MNDFKFEDVKQPLKHPVEKIPNKYQDYLYFSKLRNQKLTEINKQQLRPRQVVQREEGFSLYFNGANSELSDRKAKSTAIAPRKSRTSDETRRTEGENSARSKTSAGRRTWQSATKMGFLTERGDRLFVRPTDYYSEDFDEADIGEPLQVEEQCDIVEEIEEQIGSISVDLSMSEVRYLRDSLVLNRTYRQEPPGLREPLVGIAEHDDNDDDDNDNDNIEDNTDGNCRDEEHDSDKSRQSRDNRYNTDNDKRANQNEYISKGTNQITGNAGTANQNRDSSTRDYQNMEEKIMTLELKAANCLEDRRASMDNDRTNNSVSITTVGSSEADEQRLREIISRVMRLDEIQREKLLSSLNHIEERQQQQPAKCQVSMTTSTIRDVREGSAGDDDDEDPDCLMDRFLKATSGGTSRRSSANNGSGSARFGRRAGFGPGDDTDSRSLAGLAEQLERDITSASSYRKAVVSTAPRRPWAEPSAADQSETQLERSWSSLRQFEAHQAGRLSFDYGVSEPEATPKTEAMADFEGSAVDTEENGVEGTFTIPELPRGRHLRVEILSTWGDRHYVGLTGIELFSATGERVPVTAISASPRDVNDLPGYGTDPRVVANLLDGVNRTRDDVHMWLAPFSPGRVHSVSIEFAEECTLAMLRFWNYNKSRVHRSRGARLVRVLLDDRLVFRGEIAPVTDDSERTPGGGGEVILFTTDDATLERVGEHDREFLLAPGCDSDSEESVNLEAEALRPATASAQECVVTATEISASPELAPPGVGTVVIRLALVESWSAEEESQLVGLTGLQLFDEHDRPMHPADPISEDCTTLFNGHNVTTDTGHMWMTTLGGKALTFTVLGIENQARPSVMRLWNYNASPEDSCRGVRRLHIWIDETRVSPECGLLVRRAPGHTQYDFVQQIDLRETDRPTEEDLSQFANLPCGFVYQINVLNAWNDLYYVGLNGLAIFDHAARLIPVGPHQVHAFPDSVNSLIPKGQLSLSNLDVRTPDKLIDGTNDTYDPKHMWLAPILPGVLNKIFVVFDRPVAVSMIRLWNYAKSPARGVKDFSVLVDDLLIHSGSLPAAPTASVARGILPNMNDVVAVPSNRHRTVLFDRHNSALLHAEKPHLLDRHSTARCHGIESDVVLINNAGDSRQGRADQKFRPTTSVNSRVQVK